MIEVKYVTELGLIRSIPDLITDELKPGRLKNLMYKLQAAVDLDLGKIANALTRSEWDRIESILNEFKMVARFGKQKHVGTIVSFCLSIIEKSNHKFNDKIIETLNHICDYYERVGDLHVASMWSGDLACEKWESLFNKEKEQ